MNKILNALFGLSDESGQATHADVIDLLKEDHQNVRDLFEQFEGMDMSETREKRKLLRKIFAELELHTQLEEELVYPLIEGAKELVAEAREEHHVVDLIIAEIKKARAMNEKTDAKVKVLKEMLEHHIDEEEHEMLPRLPQDELQEIGARLKVRKEELLGKEFPEKQMVHAGVQPVEELYGGTEMGSVKEKELPEMPAAGAADADAQDKAELVKTAEKSAEKSTATTGKKPAAKTKKTAAKKTKTAGKRAGKKRSAA
jgi:iron-sulfur cluster repair protein YtfE (RIC family)